MKTERLLTSAQENAEKSCMAKVMAASGQAGVIDGILHAVVATAPATAKVESWACIWLDDPFAALQSGPVALRLSEQQVPVGT